MHSVLCHANLLVIKENILLKKKKTKICCSRSYAKCTSLSFSMRHEEEIEFKMNLIKNNVDKLRIVEATYMRPFFACHLYTQQQS